MPHVLVAGRIHPNGLAVLEAADALTFDYIEETDPEPYLEQIGAADAVLLRTQPLTAETIQTSPKLKIVSRHGVGYDTVDVAALNRRNIPLAIVGDVNSIAVSEQAMALMLAVGKRVLKMDKATRTGDWAYRNLFEPTELSGKTLLIVGFGRIGRRLSRLAAAFGMTIIAFDPFLNANTTGQDDVTLVSDLDEALPAADYLSIHMPGTGSPLLGAPELALMKPTAIVINTARGGLIDETALVDALESGKLAGAGLDVFAEEPPAPDNPLFSSDRVVVSPHVAGLSAESAERMAVAAAQNIVDYFDGTLQSELVVNAKDVTV